MVKQKNKSNEKTEIDSVMATLMGASIGCFVSGFFQITIGALCEADEGELFSITAIKAGGAILLLSAAINLLCMLYHALVPRRLGELYPPLFGFSLIPALLAMLCGAVWSGDLSAWIIYGG